MRGNDPGERMWFLPSWEVEESTLWQGGDGHFVLQAYQSPPGAWHSAGATRQQGLSVETESNPHVACSLDLASD